MIFIAEDRHGPGVRLLRNAAFEMALASLIALHGSTDPLDRVEVIVTGFSTDDRGALSGCFGDRVWGEPRREADPRGCEVQDRLTRTGDFHASRKPRPAFDAEGTPAGWTMDLDEADRSRW